jgi:ferredoxin
VSCEGTWSLKILGLAGFQKTHAFVPQLIIWRITTRGSRTNELEAALKTFHSCPLCDKLADDLSGLGSMSGERKPDNLPRHISGHLKELAILAFPPAEGHTSSKKVKSSQSDVSRNCSLSSLPELPEVFRTYAPRIDTAMIYPDTQLQRWECDNCGRYRLEIGPDQICSDCQHPRCDTCTVFTEKQPPNLMAPLTSLARSHEEGGASMMRCGSRIKTKMKLARIEKTSGGSGRRRTILHIMGISMIPTSRN